VHHTQDDIRLNLEQQAALDTMLRGGNYFLTGRGGTGKSVVIREFRKRSPRKIAVLAPTGLAALNLGDAATVHSFFELSIGLADFSRESMRLARKLSMVEAIIIDEVSMLRSDVLYAMDEALKFYRDTEQPFGGIQIILVGDFFQLPPVVEDENIRLFLEYHHNGEYAFCTQAWADARLQCLELKTIMRQRDEKYVGFLDAIREVSEDLGTAFAAINTRVQEAPQDVISLCCTRAVAEQINMARMDALTDYGKVFRGRITGKFPEERCPTDSLLRVKRRTCNVIGESSGIDRIRICQRRVRHCDRL
jgi:ATP-dependent exoDNAse (exonuclease V), alpha subunit - helicase superfamily I member